MTLRAEPLAEPYRVVKNEVAAEVTVVGQPPQVLRLFLSGQARTHAGDERPSDLLNGADPFLPAVDRGGALRILRRDAVAVPADYEPAAEGDITQDALPPSRRLMAEIALDDGTTLRGVIAYAMPEGGSRLVDFLNTGDRFLALRHAGIVHLVNKTRVVRVDAL